MLKYLPDLICTLQPSTLHHSFQTASQWCISLPFLAALTHPACATSVPPNDPLVEPKPCSASALRDLLKSAAAERPKSFENPGLSHTAEHQPQGCHISVPGFQEASVMLCPRSADGLCLETHGIYCACTDHLSSVQTKGPWKCWTHHTCSRANLGTCRKCTFWIFYSAWTVSEILDRSNE